MTTRPKLGITTIEVLLIITVSLILGHENRL